MQATNILILIVALGIFAFYIGRGRSLALAKPLGGIRNLHSLPSYYGAHTALWCALPSLILLCLWMIFDEPLINGLVMGSISDQLADDSLATYNLQLNKISNIAEGILGRRGQDAALLIAADYMIQLKTISQWALTALMLVPDPDRLVFRLVKNQSSIQGAANGRKSYAELAARLCLSGYFHHAWHCALSAYLNHCSFFVLCLSMSLFLVWSGARKRRYERIKLAHRAALVRCHYLLEPYWCRLSPWRWRCPSD
jgi:hypothetical protein